MAFKTATTANLEEFIRGAEEARKTTLSDEAIKRINDLAREAEIEEQKNEKSSEKGIAAKKSEGLLSIDNYKRTLTTIRITHAPMPLLIFHHPIPSWHRLELL